MFKRTNNSTPPAPVPVMESRPAAPAIAKIRRDEVVGLLEERLNAPLTLSSMVPEIQPGSDVIMRWGVAAWEWDKGRRLSRPLRVQHGLDVQPAAVFVCPVFVPPFEHDLPTGGGPPDEMITGSARPLKDFFETRGFVQGDGAPKVRVARFQWLAIGVRPWNGSPQIPVPPVLER